MGIAAGKRHLWSSIFSPRRNRVKSAPPHAPQGTRCAKMSCMSQEHSIRKVKVLQGRAKDEAEKQGLDPDDLVIVTTSVHPLPEYHIEKIEGDPVSFLLKRVGA